MDNILPGNITSDLWANNPYSTGEVFVFNEGDIQLGRDPLIYTKNVKDKTHTVVEGETLWSIANDELGNSKWYWVLQEVNNYLFAADININDVIIVPDLDSLFANQPQ